MKKLFTYLCSHRRGLLVAVVTLLTSVQTFALDEGYFNYFVHLGSYPTGAGKVYAELKNGSIKYEDSNFETPAESVDVMYTKKDASSQSFNAYAIPEDGWIVAGFTFGTKNEDGTFTAKADTLITQYNPGSLTPKSTISDKDSLTALSIFPLEADTAFFAVFTHVYPRLKDGQENLGKVSIDKISNNIGDQVTLTAIPEEKGEGKFAYWIEKSTGNKITENPYTFTVSKADEYYAYFENQFAETLHFPEEGGFIHHYGDYYVRYPNDNKIAIYEFEVDGVKKVTKDGKDIIVDEPGVYDYMAGAFAKVPTLLYGKGDLTIVTDTSSTTPGSEPNSVLRWSGDTGVKVDTITTNAAHHYYTFDDKAVVFRLVGDDKFVPAKQVFMAMPDSCVEKLTPGTFPDVIYTSEEQDIETGISNVTVAPTVKKKGVFTIDGRRLEAPEQEGVYIFDGKKVIYRKRK